MTVLNDLRNLRNQIHHLRSQTLRSAAIHGIGAAAETVRYAALSKMKFETRNQSPEELEIAQNARIASMHTDRAEHTIDQAICFLEAIEQIYNDIILFRNGTKVDKNSPAHFAQTVVNISVFGEKYVQTLIAIQNENIQGMNNLLVRHPPQRQMFYPNDLQHANARKFEYYTVPDYLTLIIEFIAQLNQGQLGEGVPFPHSAQPVSAYQPQMGRQMF